VSPGQAGGSSRFTLGAPSVARYAVCATLLVALVNA
jgi:hypothetical protein